MYYQINLYFNSCMQNHINGFSFFSRTQTEMFKWCQKSSDNRLSSNHQGWIPSQVGRFNKVYVLLVWHLRGKILWKSRCRIRSHSSIRGLWEYVVEQTAPRTILSSMSLTYSMGLKIETQSWSFHHLNVHFRQDSSGDAHYMSPGIQN